MDLGTTIIGGVSVAICAMPFVLTNRSKKKKVKQLLISLKNIAKEHNSEITQHDIFKYYAIGIDASKNSVSFILKTEEEEQSYFINLSTIKKCEIVKVGSSGAHSDKDIDKLDLKLSPVDKNKPDIMLEFYNAEVSYQLSDELQSIEKWNKTINNLLHSK
ncbi:hypothetical protein FF125_07630 [Aureibaculum algae]|uniref:Uncharacterized protein n=1 Tax=Aureibaculum algae TaxID=2584122 RepID=A0A5B7TPV9_9FLAO|nr:hypothetical protein [Aureibaculum algae]QCX38308.1 hypothetical protein FF125_07630 [Aureibaculum algae]